MPPPHLTLDNFTIPNEVIVVIIANKVVITIILLPTHYQDIIIEKS